MHLLKLIVVKIFFYANFPSVSIFQCEASERSLLTSERMQIRCPDGKVARSDARGPLHAYMAMRVRMS
jgi:hypothetical protein